jgi:hypothetical protein
MSAPQNRIALIPLAAPFQPGGAGNAARLESELVATTSVLLVVGFGFWYLLPHVASSSLTCC